MSDVISDDRERESPLQANKKEEFVIPVVEEYLEVSTQPVTTGVARIDKSVREHEVTISEPLNSEAVHVERVPMNVIVGTAPAVRTEGDVTIIPVLEEVLVTTKQLRLIEEVRITKLRSTRIYQQNAIVRREEVTVERQAIANSSEAGKDRLD